MKTAGIILAAVALLAFGIWSNYAAPCSMWSWAPVKDVPARCLLGGHR